MKTKIIALLSAFSLSLIIGGVLLMRTIDADVARFNELALLHQVESQREHLLLHMHKADYYAFVDDRERIENIREATKHVRDMEDTIAQCFTCHHQPAVLERIENLENRVEKFDGMLSDVLRMNAGPAQRRASKEAARNVSRLIRERHSMNALDLTKLKDRMDGALQQAKRTRTYLVELLALGPLSSIILAFIVIRGFTRPIHTLLAATKRIECGDLEVQVSGLRDEYAELASSFNTMAAALRKQVESIQESEQRYRLLFESAADSILILDAEGDQAGRIVQANSAAAQLNGYSVDELKTKRIQDIDTWKTAAGTRERMRRLVQGERLTFEVEHVKRNGSVLNLEVSAVAFEQGGHHYTLGIGRDITARKKADEALQRAEQIKTAGELATHLAHEIKNPLAGIKVSMQALAEESYLKGEDRELLTKVTGEIERIDALMKGLLKFARPAKPRLEVTDVHALLDAVAGLALEHRFPQPAGNQAIRLCKRYAPSLPHVMADPAQLQQVFMNLLMNAADAMPGGGTVTLSTALDPATQSLRIDLADTGRGIDPAIMAKTFQPFFTTKPKGTGLGLAITKRLIEEHGGHITIASNDGGGATVRIYLPLPNEQGA